MFEKCVNKFFVVSILIIATLLPVVAQQLPQYPKMSNQAADDMAGTWTFYIAQTLLVQSYSEKFPTLSEDLKMAQILFDAKFADSISNIDKILTIENRPWKSTKQKIFQRIEGAVIVQKQQATYAQAKALIEEIRKKTEGKIPSPYLETLLIYKTDFLKQPADEFLEGYKNSFLSGNHPKSSGVSFAFSYPQSWKTSEGRLKSVIKKFVSENGRGFEGLLLAVKPLPVSSSKKISPAEIKEFLSLKTIKKSLPSDARIISQTPMKIDGLPSTAVLFEAEQMQLDGIFKSRVLSITILFENKLVFF